MSCPSLIRNLISFPPFPLLRSKVADSAYNMIMSEIDLEIPLSFHINKLAVTRSSPPDFVAASDIFGYPLSLNLMIVP